MAKKTSNISIQELRTLMRKLGLPGSYNITAENKNTYIEMIRDALMKQGFTCDTTSKTIVTTAKQRNVICKGTLPGARTEKPVSLNTEQDIKASIIENVDMDVLVKKLIAPCKT